MSQKSTPANQALYDEVVAEAKKKFDVWPSIYASSWVVREYKKRGGRYLNPATGLQKWYAERWVDLGRSTDTDGKVKGWVDCGRPDAGKGAYPKCVPIDRARKMSPSERKSAIRRKRKAESVAPKKKGRSPVMVKTVQDNPRKTLYIKPNEAARKKARMALERRKKLPKSKRGGLDAMQAHEQGIGSGVMRARDIAAGKRINAYQVKAFFDRHRSNYVNAKVDGKRWEDSKAWQAWDLWGGEPLRKQVEAAVRKDKKMRSNPRSKAYTVYLVQDKPKTLVVYKFKSDTLICPSASASEYAWMLGESALPGRGTHIFTTDARLKNFLKKFPEKRIVAGKIRRPNPRNSKVKDALAAEATKFKDFKDFSAAYWDACSRGLYWVATNEKKFHIGDAERRKINQGRFFVYCSPKLALEASDKKYVAELDVTRVPSGSIAVKKGSDGTAIKIVDGAGGIKVPRVLTKDAAMKAFKWQLSILPSSKEGLREFWKQAWEKRNKKAELIKAKREKKAERELLRAEKQAKEEAEAARKAAKEKVAAEKKAKRDRVARGTKARKDRARKQRVARTRAETKAKWGIPTEEEMKGL